MKAGTLVKWDHHEKEHQDVGVIYKISRLGWHVHWFLKPHLGGIYPIEHRLFKVISEV